MHKGSARKKGRVTAGTIRMFIGTKVKVERGLKFLVFSVKEEVGTKCVDTDYEHS